MCLQQFLQIISTGLIALTVFFLWRYTRATKKLMESSVEHNEILTRPFITVLSGMNDLEIKNAGNGTAIIKSVEDIEVTGISIPELGFENESMLVSMGLVDNILEPQQSLKYGFDGSSDSPEFDRFIKDKKVRYFGFPFFKFEVKEYKLTVQYENILQQKYTSIFTVNCKKRRVKLTSFQKIQK